MWVKGKWSECGNNCPTFRHNGVEIDRPEATNYDGLDFLDFFLIGVESSHSNSNEDRKFQLFYAASTKYRLEGCTWSTESLNHQTLQVPSSGQQTTWGIKNIKLLIK